MTAIARFVALVVLAAMSVVSAARAATPAYKTDAAVYGGSLGPLSSPLGPDALYVTADAAASTLTGIGATFIVDCPPSGVPLTVNADRVIPAAGGAAPAGVLGADHNAAGRFSGRLLEPGPDGSQIEIAISARFSSHHASGTLRARIIAATGEQTCATKTLYWRAERRPGRIFAGAMPGVGTVVITRLGTDDLRFHTSIATNDCAGGPPWLVPTIAIEGGFGIHRGRFTRPVDDMVGPVQTDYTIAGRVGDMRASGTFAGTLQSANPGQPAWTCSIHSVHWSAKSG
jgi:hypothetical protein